MKKITVGVIGAGRIGKLHIDNIQQHLALIDIKRVADPYLDESWAKQKAIPHFSTEADDVIHDKDIEAVLVCSPSSLHVQHIVACANAGKHVFCEKPIATDISDIETALYAVKEAGVKLQIGFNRRFDPNFARIKQLLKTNEIGKPHLLRITSRDPKIPPAEFLKQSGGMFLDMTIHDFDMARFLMASEVQEVYASGNVLIDPVFAEHDDIDTAVINLKFANGSLGVIDNSRQAVYGYDQRVEVFGSAGAAYADNNKMTNTTLSTKDGILSDKPLYFFLERYKESFVAELQAFYHCIINDTAPLVSGLDGLLSVVVGQATHQSLRENRPIKIDYEKWGALA